MLCNSMNNNNMMMGIMPGCTVKEICKDSSLFQKKGREFCQPFSILTDICKYDMPKMTGCSHFT